MIYNDYSDAYRLNQFDAGNVDFLTKLVIDTYVFDANHKPLNTSQHEILSASCLATDVITTQSMSEIMHAMLTNMKKEIQENLSTVLSRVEELFAGDADKIVRIQNILTMDSAFELYEFWHKLKAEGIKYFIVEHPLLDICCFCEEIEVV